MLFHENRLLADDSHKISYLIFYQKLGMMSQNVSSVAVVIGALRVKYSLQTYVARIQIRISTEEYVKRYHSRVKTGIATNLNLSDAMIQS